MALRQPERGGRQLYSERLGVEAKCRGVYIVTDASTPPTGALVMLRNARVVDDIVQCRGGQSKRNSTAVMDGPVYGMIDTDGEFD